MRRHRARHTTAVNATVDTNIFEIAVVTRRSGAAFVEAEKFRACRQLTPHNEERGTNDGHRGRDGKDMPINDHCNRVHHAGTPVALLHNDVT